MFCTYSKWFTQFLFLFLRQGLAIVQAGLDLVGILLPQPLVRGLQTYATTPGLPIF